MDMLWETQCLNIGDCACTNPGGKALSSITQSIGSRLQNCTAYCRQCKGMARFYVSKHLTAVTSLSHSLIPTVKILLNCSHVYGLSLIFKISCVAHGYSWGLQSLFWQVRFKYWLWMCVYLLPVLHVICSWFHFWDYNIITSFLSSLSSLQASHIPSPCSPPNSWPFFINYCYKHTHMYI